MELKNYQKEVVKDLKHYIELLTQCPNASQAFNKFWQEKCVRVGSDGILAYQDIIWDTPNICFKVPTGGGKTFIACNCIKPVFDAMPLKKPKVVVWLVPSDSILEQTIKCLQNVNHPYRQKIDTHFGGRVEVYTKQELLNGQSFNPTTVSEQLSILVLSYDSFRASNKEGRKVYQENGNLAQFVKYYNLPDSLLKDVDETALVQVINQMSPLIIVDESHHAQSDLSVEMLKNLNPCFVIDLTATPKKNSNIISYVDALQLKKENMVKLPVIVYNRHSQEDVLIGAIDLRNNLEKAAVAEREATGKYIRPIVLFQAQPKGNDDNTTFEKLKARLINIGIPTDEIAIKTSNVNQLINIDLMSEDCKIRYIITVNALKEGWDCPFAYILATLANRTSTVDVEQILGRILRQPYTKQHTSRFLNMSYVLTSSNDFITTVNKIILGLNNAGFSKNECRVVDNNQEAPISAPTIEKSEQQSFVNASTVNVEMEEFLGFDAEKVKTALTQIEQQCESNMQSEALKAMFTSALVQADVYNAAVVATDNSEIFLQPVELRDKMNIFRINPEFLDDVKDLKLPQFFIKIPKSVLDASGLTLLTQTGLSDGFTLKDKDISINFNTVDDEIVKVDIEGIKEAVPKFSKLGSIDSKAFKEYFSKLPAASKITTCKQMIYGQLNRIDTFGAGELSKYIDKIFEVLDADQLADLENNMVNYTDKIRSKILSMQSEYCEKQFFKMIDQGKIVCSPSFAFKEIISPLVSTSTISKSLYTAEEGNMNDFEYKAITTIAALPNIKWWHRNISRNGFCINGFVNHYPDFILMTTSGRIVLVETKGDHLELAKQKIEMGGAWHKLAGDAFRYYMVFQNRDVHIHGTYNLESFMDIIMEL